jgi:hypothetical protein
MQGHYNQSRPPARSGSSGSQMQSGRGAIAQGVASGQIGGAYGPYSVSFWFLVRVKPAVNMLALQVSSIIIAEQRRPQPFTIQRCPLRSLFCDG